MINPFEDINKQIMALKKSQTTLRWGTVKSISPFKVQFDGETTSNIYHRPKNYTPIVNDRVCFLIVQKQYICLGAYE